MFRAHTGDSKGLTPAVGVLLLLIVTLLLSLTAVAFVVGLSEEPSGSPTAAFGFTLGTDESGSETVTVMHRAGNAIDADSLYVVVDGARCVGGSDVPDGRYNVDDDFQMGPDTMSSGMTVQFGRDIDIDGAAEICQSGHLSLDAATFRIVWESPSGNTIELQTWTA